MGMGLGGQGQGFTCRRGTTGKWDIGCPRNSGGAEGLEASRRGHSKEGLGSSLLMLGFSVPELRVMWAHVSVVGIWKRLTASILVDGIATSI